MAPKPKILLIDDSPHTATLVASLRKDCELVTAPSPSAAVQQLEVAHEDFSGILFASEHLKEAVELGRLIQSERILEGMPDGVVLLNIENEVIWANDCFKRWSGESPIIDHNFYQALGSPEILGPDFCPFHTAMATGRPSGSTLRTADNRYFQVHAAPVIEHDGRPRHLIVTVRDVTNEVLQQQKLVAIHQAGIELADLKPEEILDMPVADRIELVKSNILHFTKDLLQFDVIEIRLLDSATGRLEPLLSVGMDPVAEQRVLYAQPQNNGVTGFVAATGKSYLCEDTTQDPLYLEGSKGAKSSLTVPLILHDEVMGTFNVESPEPRAFTESDLQFLEIFSRDVAVALNTLDLLAAEQASTAMTSVEAIHSAVALPIDEILNEAVNVMERYIGHEPEVVERLQRILRNARDIKQVIQKVGQKMAPSTALPQPWQIEERPLLRGIRVLVADADDSVRSAAHALLERYGCVVETAHNGGEAVFMVRNAAHDEQYDCVIADIRLPDFNGYELLQRLQPIMDPLPLVLMTGFGYDPSHSLVKARQAGVQNVLYKPFRLDQLLQTVEQTLVAPSTVKLGS